MTFEELEYPYDLVASFFEEIRRKSWEAYAERTGLVTADEIVLPFRQSVWRVPVATPLELFDEKDPVPFEGCLVDEYELYGEHDDGYLYRRIRRGRA